MIGFTISNFGYICPLLLQTTLTSALPHIIYEQHLIGAIMQRVRLKIV
jgi:hypothetical protein